MYLATRRVRLNLSDLREALGWAAQMAEHVSQVTGVATGLWSKVHGPEPDMLVWTAWMPDLTAVETFDDKLMADDRYFDLVQQGARFFIPGSLDDSLSAVVHPDPLPENSRQANFVSTVSTICANGHVGDGLALGVELARRSEELTGMPTAFLAATTGDYGGVTWIASFADAAEAERANAALMSDSGWIEMVDKRAGAVYSSDPGATVQELYRRIV